MVVLEAVSGYSYKKLSLGFAKEYSVSKKDISFSVIILISVFKLWSPQLCNSEKNQSTTWTSVYSTIFNLYSQEFLSREYLNLWHRTFGSCYLSLHTSQFKEGIKKNFFLMISGLKSTWQVNSYFFLPLSGFF